MPGAPGGATGTRLGAGVGGVAPLGVDQLAEPAHLALDGLHAVPLQGRGVGVEPLAAAGGGLADAVEALLERASAGPRGCAAGPRCSVRAKKAKCTSKLVVLPGRRAGRGDEVGEVLLAVGGELVDDAGALAAGRGRVGGLRDQAAVEQALQAG